MDLPQPPNDQDLKNIIDKLAQFVARNGPEFEQMTKSKQKDNPKFSFLFGGEYFNYYQFKVTTEQAILKHRQSRDQHHGPGAINQPPPPGTQGSYNSTAYPQSYPNYSFPPFHNSEVAQYPPAAYGQFPPQQTPPEHGSQPQPFGPPPNSGFPTGDGSFVPPPSFSPMPTSQESMFPQPNYQQGPPPPPTQSHDPQPFPSQQSGGDQMPYSSAPFPVMPTTQHGAQLSPASIAQQQQQLQEQIKQSEDNLAAQQNVLDQQKTMQIREGIYVAIGEVLRTEAADYQFHVQELDELLSPIIENCTKDSISNGKHWIFTHAISAEKNNWISQYLLWKSTSYSSTFVQKLHVIYLMNDVLHNCVRKNADNLKEALQKVLVPMFCSAMSIASEEQKGKLDKLLSLWESKLRLEEDVLEELRSPLQSWAEYEKCLADKYPQVIATINQHILTTFEGYQQQHTAFVQHATNQIQQLEQQKLQLEQQIPIPPIAQGGQFGPPQGSQGHSFSGNVTGTPPINQTPGIDYNQPPPGFPQGGFPVVDFSKPPPGFSVEEQQENLVPSVPYYELPAALMAPLVSLSDNRYKPLDQDNLRLPPPTPASERLLRAIENFYEPPSHERPRNTDGWEQLALFDYYKAKSRAVKQKENDIAQGIIESSRSPSPIVLEEEIDEDIKKTFDIPLRRYRSVSPEDPNMPRHPSPITPNKKLSPEPPRMSEMHSRELSESPPPPMMGHSSPDSKSSTPEPLVFGEPSYMAQEQRLNEENKGHQMLCRMGWGGSGLGAQEQGISDPIEAGSVRDESSQDRYRGLGVTPSVNVDPYEAFRKNKGQAFINRMKARAEEKSN